MGDYKELVADLNNYREENCIYPSTICIKAAEAIERLSAAYENMKNGFNTMSSRALKAERELAKLKSASAEPVAWMYEDNLGRKVTSIKKPTAWRPHTHIPLYLHAPAAVQEDAKDAARYRHLKHDENFCIDELDCDGRWEPVGNLDVSIDAAMKESKE